MDPAPHTTAPRRTINSVLGHVAMLLLTAVLLGGAFPQPGWWPLAWVALVPMAILAARTRRPWRLAWTSYLVFLGWWLVRLSWLIPVTGGGWVGLCVLMAAYWTLAALTLHLIDRRWPLPMALTLPMAWVSFEFLRGTFIEGGFGWFAIGHTQAPYLPTQSPGRIAQTADLFGEWTVGLIVCMTNGVLADLILRPWFRPMIIPGTNVRGRRLRRTMRATLFLWAMILSIAWFYGQFRLGETKRVTREGVAVAVVQTNVPQSNKQFPTPAQDRQRWEELVTLTRAAAAAEPRPALIAWPETMVPGAINPEAVDEYAMEAVAWAATSWDRLAPERRARLTELARDWGVEPETIPATLAQWNQDKARYAAEIRSLARELGIAILVGSPTEAMREGGRANSAYLIDATGAATAERYDKVHLVPFGEYIPWVRSSEWLMHLFTTYLSPYGFDHSLTPGDSFTLFEIETTEPAGGDTASGFTFAAPICFEDAVPAVCRQMVFREGGKAADLLVNLTNDGWFTGTAQPWQHLQIATFRSIENRVPTARSVNTGVSGFIDSAGRVGPLVYADARHTDVAGVRVHVVRFDPRYTLFAVVGRAPIATLCLITLGLVVAACFRRDREPEQAAAEPA